MGTSFKYTLGINELASKKHRLPNALLAEFVGEFYKQMDHTRIQSRENIILFFIYSNIVRRYISVELLRVLNMHIWWSNDDVIRFRSHHLRCCDGNELFTLFTFYLFQWLGMVIGGMNPR